MPEASTDISPRPALNRERITEAALALADARGVEGLSMRALAAELGVEAMSLYNHIRNKNDLIDAMVESVVARIERPQPGPDWQEQMRRRARSMRILFLAHPWVPMLIVGRINLGPNMLALTDASLGCLRAAGFSHVAADQVLNALDSYIYGFHLLEQSFPLRPEDYRDAARSFLPEIDAGTYPHLVALGQMVADGRYDGVNRLEFGLDRLLRALDADRGE